jgi:O-antigen/teichoic acid export membrane protein
MPAILVRNVTANILQMLLGAMLVFFLYRHISKELGIEALGLWSVMLATTSAFRLAEFGLGAGITRFVARYLALQAPEKAALVVETGILTLSFIVPLILLVTFPVFEIFLNYIFEEPYRSKAIEILPYVLVSVWLMIIAAVIQSGLDGCQRMVSRAVLVLTGQSLMTSLSFWFISDCQLIGLAMAQIVQGIFLVIVGWIILRQHLKEVSRIPFRWRLLIFLEMLRYSFNVQAASFLMLLFEPFTKALMVKFGGVSAAGYFEIANQLVTRVRSVIIAANQTLVPKVAQVVETAPSQLNLIYQANIRLLVVVALPIYCVLFVWGGVITGFVLEDAHEELTSFTQLCATAWFINTFAAPAYFLNMGTGAVFSNTRAHFVTGFLNALLALVLGSEYGALGVAYSYAIALTVGSFLLIATFQKANALRWSELFLPEHVPIMTTCLITALLGFSNLQNLDFYGSISILWLLILHVLIILIVLSLHPLVAKILRSRAV